jgi:hypothetical protein
MYGTGHRTWRIRKGVPGKNLRSIRDQILNSLLIRQLEYILLYHLRLQLFLLFWLEYDGDTISLRVALGEGECG